MKPVSESHDVGQLFQYGMSDSSESNVLEPIRILNELDQIQGPSTFQELLIQHFEPEELDETFLDEDPLGQYWEDIRRMYDSQLISGISGNDFFCIISELRDSLTEDSVEELMQSISGVLLGTFIRLYRDQVNQLGWDNAQIEKIEALYS